MLWGLPLRKEVGGDLGTQGAHQESIPLLVELWLEESPTDPLPLLR